MGKFLWFLKSIRAETIISACAIVTLAFALYQNYQTASLIQSAYHAFEASAYPTIGFSYYQWYIGPSGLSCENPPSGVNVYYRNFSGVPVIIEKNSLKTFKGEREIDLPEHTPPTTEHVLPPGTLSAIGREGGKEFPIVYKELLGNKNPPHLIFELTVIYRSLVSGKRYQYIAKIRSFDDCRLPKQVEFRKEDKISELPIQ